VGRLGAAHPPVSREKKKVVNLGISNQGGVELKSVKKKG